MKFYAFLLAGACLGSVLLSCKKQEPFGTTTWSPDLAVPLVSAEFTLKDIVARSRTNITEDAQGMLTFVYNTTLVSTPAADALQLGDQSFSQSVGVDQDIINSLQNTAVPLNTSIDIPTIPTQVIDFQISPGSSLDSVYLKQGNISINASSDFHQDIRLNFKIPNATLNGQVFDEELPLTYTGTAPVTLQKSINLTGYKLSLVNNALPNKLSIEISGTITKTTNDAQQLSDMLRVNMSMSGLKFSKAYGRLAQQNLTPDQDTADITIFDNAYSKGIKIKNPVFTFNVQNSFGVPMNLSFPILNAFRKSAPSTIFPISGTPNPFSVSAPLPGAIPGVTNDTFSLRSSNSNISGVLFEAPSRIVYKLSTTLNPGGPTQNFFYDTSTLRTRIKIELPFEGYIKDFAFLDTVPFAFDRPDRIDQLVLRTNITNDFPVEAKLQMYFVTDNFEVKDSLFNTTADQVVVPQASVNANGESVSPGNKVYDITYNAAREGKLAGVTKIILLVRLNSTDSNNNQYVKFFSRYKMAVKLGMRAKLKIAIR